MFVDFCHFCCCGCFFWPTNCMFLNQHVPKTSPKCTLKCNQILESLHFLPSFSLLCGREFGRSPPIPGVGGGEEGQAAEPLQSPAGGAGGPAGGEPRGGVLHPAPGVRRPAGGGGWGVPDFFLLFNLPLGLQCLGTGLFVCPPFSSLPIIPAETTKLTPHCPLKPDLKLPPPPPFEWEST